jgi:hypothetical protein
VNERRLVLVLYVFSGVCGLVYEIVWMRHLALIDRSAAPLRVYLAELTRRISASRCGVTSCLGFAQRRISARADHAAAHWGGRRPLPNDSASASRQDRSGRTPSSRIRSLARTEYAGRGARATCSALVIASTSARTPAISTAAHANSCQEH